MTYRIDCLEGGLAWRRFIIPRIWVVVLPRTSYPRSSSWAMATLFRLAKSSSFFSRSIMRLSDMDMSFSLSPGIRARKIGQITRSPAAACSINNETLDDCRRIETRLSCYLSIFVCQAQVFASYIDKSTACAMVVAVLAKRNEACAFVKKFSASFSILLERRALRAFACGVRHIALRFAAIVATRHRVRQQIAGKGVSTAILEN